MAGKALVTGNCSIGTIRLLCRERASERTSKQEHLKFGEACYYGFKCHSKCLSSFATCTRLAPIAVLYQVGPARPRLFMKINYYYPSIDWSGHCHGPRVEVRARQDCSSINQSSPKSLVHPLVPESSGRKREQKTSRHWLVGPLSLL